MSRKTLALLSVLVAVPSTALAADDVGTVGRISDLQVNMPSSDSYLAYHGRMFIKNGNNVEEYRWGGTACGSRILTENAVMMLQRALDSGLRVQPRWQPGQGTSRCVVGFAFTD